MQGIKDVVKNVLTDFLGTEINEDDTYEDNFIGVVADEEEIEILSTAISEAVERNYESKN